MTTTGRVGRASVVEKPEPAKPEPGKQEPKPKEEKEKEKPPREQFQAIINEWHAMLPVAFVNRLEEFADKNIGKVQQPKPEHA